MSENRNLYKMDDAFIILSYFMVVPVCFMLWPWLKGIPLSLGSDWMAFFQSAPGILGTRLFMAGGYLIASLLLQIMGRMIRRKEKHSLDILDILSYNPKSTISHLASQLSFSESYTAGLVAKLASMRSLGIFVTGDDVELNKQKARENNIPEVIREKINKKVAEKISPSLQQIKEELEKQKNSVSGERPKTLKEIMEEQRNAGNSEENTSEEEAIEKEFFEEGNEFVTERYKQASSGSKKAPFNIILFAVLMMTPLWPVALIYAGRKLYKQAKENSDGNSAAP